MAGLLDSLYYFTSKAIREALETDEQKAERIKWEEEQSNRIRAVFKSRSPNFCPEHPTWRYMTPQEVEAEREYETRKKAQQNEAKLKAEIETRERMTISWWVSRCESPAESKMLLALIDRFKLKPADGHMKGTVRLETQVKIPPYRVDVLLDGYLVVEVDGFEYHSGAKEAQRDARRDKHLRRLGYRVLRIPAYRIFTVIDSAVDDVVDALGM